VFESQFCEQAFWAFFVAGFVFSIAKRFIVSVFFLIFPTFHFGFDFQFQLCFSACCYHSGSTSFSV